MDRWNDHMENGRYEEYQEHWNSQNYEYERMEDRSYQGYEGQWDYGPHEDNYSERVLTMDEFYEAHRLMREWIRRISQPQWDSQPYCDEEHHWNVNQGSGPYEETYDPYHGEHIQREISLDHERYQGYEGHWSSQKYENEGSNWEDNIDESGSYQEYHDPQFTEHEEYFQEYNGALYEHDDCEKQQVSNSKIMELLIQMKMDMDRHRAKRRAERENDKQENELWFHKMEEESNLIQTPMLENLLPSNNEDGESFRQPIIDLEKENFKSEGEVFFKEVHLMEEVFLEEHWVKVACFVQSEDEKLHEACERFTKLKLQYPNHGFKREELSKLFYIRMPQDAKRAMNGYAGGNFVDLNPTEQAKVVQHMEMESRRNWESHLDLTKLEEVHTISLTDNNLDKNVQYGNNMKSIAQKEENDDCLYSHEDNSLGDEGIVDNLSDEPNEINPLVDENEDGLASSYEEAMLVMSLPPPKPPDKKMKVLNFPMGDSNRCPPLPKLNFDEINDKKMVDGSHFSLGEECENVAQGSLTLCPIDKASFAWKRRRKKKERSHPLKPTYCKKPSHKVPKSNQRLGEEVIMEIERMYKEIFKDKFHIIHRLSRDPSKGLLKCASC